MSWFYLVAAGLLEMTWPLALKYAWTDDGVRLRPALVFLVCTLSSFGMLMLALRAGAIPVGTAYSVWTGIGAAGTVILGIVVFHEPVAATRLLFLGLIIVGLVGLKFTSAEGH